MGIVMDLKGRLTTLLPCVTENGKIPSGKVSITSKDIDLPCCHDDLNETLVLCWKDINIRDSRANSFSRREKSDCEIKDTCIVQEELHGCCIVKNAESSNMNPVYAVFMEPEHNPLVNVETKHNPDEKDGPKCMGSEIMDKLESYAREDADFGRVKHNKNRHNKIILIIMIATFILSGICLIIVVIKFVEVIRSNNTDEVLEPTGSTSTFPEVCIECLKMIKNPYRQTDPDELVDGLIKKYDNGALKCCAKNHIQISAVLEAMLRDQEMYSDTLLYDSPSVSAHRLMKFEEAVTITGDETTGNSNSVLLFDSSNSSASTEHTRGINVTKHGFIISFTGIYFIYSNVHFHSRIIKDQTLYSYIHRTRPNSGASTGILMKTAHTNCDSCTKESRETSFTGGVFLLKAGDFIQVTVSERGLVDFNKESTYLGLIMMGYK